jgi:outer membrane murein-binding lipoprotein Lpp
VIEMVEELLREILQEVKVTRQKVELLEEKAGSLEAKMGVIETKVDSLETKVDALEETVNETKAICEAVRHVQEVLTAKYDALSLDVHKMQGSISHLTNVLEQKVLPALHDHESSI